MDQDSITNLILRASKMIEGKKRLPCPKAFALARKCGISLPEMAGLCNRHGIKISQCLLGCFQ